MSATVLSPPAAGDAEVRFEFGKNWSRFLRTLNAERIQQAQISLQRALQLESLSGRTFLDIGSGSGLSSLAARRMGADVISFDYDPDSVACTRVLKEKFFPGDSRWRIERGSALDAGYLQSLGQFDVVYSWGVLHHTGDMYKGLELAAGAVAAQGRLLIAIYNDQGSVSRRWHTLKRSYVRSPELLKPWLALLTFAITWLRGVPRDFLRLQPARTWRAWRSYSRERGMSPWHDVVDWAGGYPFEVATPEAIFNFYRQRGFRLEGLKTCGGGKGCNEFLFTRAGSE